MNAATAVIPVKKMAQAKQRLAPILSPHQRRTLFRAMLEDVINSLLDCEQIEDILIVTPDNSVSSYFKHKKINTLAETHGLGLNAAVEQAANYLAQQQVKRMLFVPGDVPLISQQEILQILSAPANMPATISSAPLTTTSSTTSSTTLSTTSTTITSTIASTITSTSADADLVIVPDKQLNGTNCIYCSPKLNMQFSFGHHSFQRHLKIAQRKKLNCRIVELPNIGLDIDTADDLRQLLQASETNSVKTAPLSYQYLLQAGVAQRINTSEYLNPQHPAAHPMVESI